MESKNLNLEEDILPFEFGRYYEDYPTRGYNIKFKSNDDNERRISLVLTKQQGKIIVRQEGQPIEVTTSDIVQDSEIEFNFDEHFNITLQEKNISLSPQNLSLKINKISKNKLFELNAVSGTPHNVFLVENELLGINERTITQYHNLSAKEMTFIIEVDPQTLGEYKLIGTLKVYIGVNLHAEEGAQVKIHKIPFSLNLNVLENDEQ